MLSYEDKIRAAISLLQSIPQDGPVELAYSGGKDSDVILELAKMAGIRFEAVYKNTTVDPPGTRAHCEKNGVTVLKPKETMLRIIEKSGPPTRRARFCCEVLKEYRVYNRVIVGIRRCESRARAERYKEPEVCRLYGKERVVQYLPILEWTDSDVERFIKERGITCHPLYYDDLGNFHVERRLGCIGCPMSKRNAVLDFKKYPKMLSLWLKSTRKWRESHQDCASISLFRDEYDQMYSNLFCSSRKDYLDRINIPIYPVGCKDRTAWLERYFGVPRSFVPHFPDERYKLNTKLFLEDEFGINFAD